TLIFTRIIKGRAASLLFASVCVLGLSACQVLPEAKSLRLFTLPQDRAASLPRQDATLSKNLRVRAPQANRVISSSRIAVVPRGSELSAYSGARWSDPAPTLLRDRLIEAFMQDGRLQGVYDEDNRLRADVELSGELR